VPSEAEWIHLDRKATIRPLALNVKIRPDHKIHAHDHQPGFPIPGFPRHGHDG